MKDVIKEHKKYFIIIIFLSLILMIFLNMGEARNAHDISFHVSNIEKVKEEIDPLHFKFTASLLRKNMDHLGYGLYIFYPSLPHLTYAYVYKILDLFHINALQSIQITNTLLTILSSLFIYLLSYRLSKNKKISFLSSIIFLLFPYRLSGYFIRFSVNENFTVPFLIIAFFSLLDLKEHHYKRFFYLFTTSIICLLYSHLAITLYFFLIFLIPYLLLYHKEIFTKKALKTISISFLFIFLFTLPFLLNLCLHLSSNYVAFHDGVMTSLDLIKENAFTIKDLLSFYDEPWTVICFIPKILFLSFILSSILIILHKKKDFFFFFIISILSLFMMHKSFPWERVPHFLWFIQFPWRLETLLMITFPILAPFFIEKIKYGFFLIFLFLSLELINPLKLIYNTPYRLENGVVPNTYIAGNIGDYYPIEYLTKKEYYETRKNEILLLKGDLSFETIKEDFPNLIFKVEYVKKAEIELPRLYYLGYELKKENKKIPLKRSSNGFISADIKEKGIYTLIYKKPLLVRMTLYIKYIFAVLFLLFLLKKKEK